MKRGLRGGWLAAVFLAAIADPLAGQEVAAGLEFDQYHLDNGLEVILVQDHSVPVVAVNVWYRVGAANEGRGRTGFAHLFEHMMFQGSANIDKGEHMQLIERAGGSMNGTTSADRTNYFETLPASQLPLGLWLEADRMRSLAVTQENLDNQREVVKEERRLRLDNAPYGASINAAVSTVPYSESGCFAYAHEVIGSMEDLDAADLDDVQEFFDLYYAPTNATLTVVGDFDPEVARELIEQYFGEIPAGGEVPEIDCSDPFSHLPVEETFVDVNANLPAVFMSYGVPPVQDADAPALNLLADILAGGESSRLHQRLVRQEQAAVEVLNFADLRRGPGLVVLGAISNQGVTAERLRELIDEELDRLSREGVRADELEKVKNQHRSGTVRGLQTALGTAEALQQANFFHGDPGAVRTELERIMAVTTADLQRVAQQYLRPDNRAVVFTQVSSAAEEE